jgi:hypothetical protein
MQVTIHDEAGRRAVLFALWTRAARGIGECFEDELAREAEAAIKPYNDAPGVFVTKEVTLLTATLLDVEEAKSATVGTPFRVSMSTDTLREALDHCIASITEDEHFWQATQADRDQIVATHDAAVRLLDELPKPAGVVA